MKRAMIGLAAVFVMAMLALPASAATSFTEDFSSFTAPTFTDGTNGWSYTGNYDVGIASPGIDGNSMRISSAVESGSFSDWPNSPALDPAATETGNQEFTASFDIQSATGAYQAGQQINVSPETGGGARMSYLRFEDQPDGIHVFFSDALDPSGTIGGETFRTVDIDTLTYTEVHTVVIKMDLIPGPHNDVVAVYIDGGPDIAPAQAPTLTGFYAPVDNPNLVNTAKAGQSIPVKWTLTAQPATTWEDYYRFDGESNAGIPQADWTTRPVDSLIFRAGCPGIGVCTVSGLSGNGYLFDNISYSSSLTPTLPSGVQPVSDPSVYGGKPLTFIETPCGEFTNDGTDAIEQAASGASGLQYLGSGNWQFNWQTLKTYARTCGQIFVLGHTANFEFTR